jgi:hypothetical protein
MTGSDYTRWQLYSSRKRISHKEAQKAQKTLFWQLFVLSCGEFFFLKDIA